MFRISRISNGFKARDSYIAVRFSSLPDEEDNLNTLMATDGIVMLANDLKDAEKVLGEVIELVN